MNTNKKGHIDINDLTPYQLGIMWSIGSYIKSEQRMVFRHKNKYFLDQLQILTNNGIYSQITKDYTQYALKTSLFNINQLKQYGWNKRNATPRNAPLLPLYKDFLRAYIELHGNLDYCTTYSNKRSGKQKYYRLRLRIYGNESLIRDLNKIIHQEIGLTLKTPQVLNNNKTTILIYTSLEELNILFNYIFDTPYSQKFWNHVDYCLSNPRKY